MMNELLEKCSWPKLPEKYDKALRIAVQHILENYKALGIIVSGTVVRGNPDPASDLDIYVIHAEPFRQRLQKFYNAVPAEVFINPPVAIEGYFQAEQDARKPITAHMLATGFVVLKLAPVVDSLRKKADELLSEAPAAPSDLTIQRYMLAMLYEDAVDVLKRDAETAKMIINDTVIKMLEFYFIKTGSFIPKEKRLLSELATTAPETARIARSFYREKAIEEKMKLAGELADRIVGERSFFEWETSPEKVSG